MFAKFFLRTNLVESEPAFFNPVTGVSDAAVLENFLDLPVLTESSVNGDEGKIDIIGELEIFVPNVDLQDFDA